MATVLDSLFFSSVLTSAYQDELERLLFFNPQQETIDTWIMESVERYGNPKIVNDAGLLRVSIGTLSHVQTLFALETNGSDRNLIGVIVHFREDVENMTILHVAVREDYSASGDHADAMLAMRLINKVLESASRIKGVRSVTLIYQAGGVKRIPVRHVGK